MSNGVLLSSSAARAGPRAREVTAGYPTVRGSNLCGPAPHYGGRVPDRVRQLPLGVVLVVVAAGLAVGATGAWRPGASLIGLGVLLAGALRLVLPVRRAGLLVVRSRRLDASMLLALGAALLVLASSVPQP